MNAMRVLRTSVISIALAGFALAQVPPPAPGGAPGPGRGALPPVVIGPSAPVPAEVAIPRPFPGELTQVNEAVTNWIASLKPSAADAGKGTLPAGTSSPTMDILTPGGLI